ncbi:hypothetical protein PN36_06105 [Candidatus Thiomargarita nelsonii]|uniref:Secreted protein n=1 Tax=Candidatus Thiomargarita nelsonii TaxID=1003181 RepID=A0A0A6P8E7_9GAMM|nr:hypothetical protein PN36_06105 [Candidatus Thiomargarita nelsonii]
MKNLLLVFMFLTLLSACGAPNNFKPQAYEKSAVLAQSMPKELTFTEESSFDKQLSTAMQSGETVTVVLPKSIEPEDEMPSQLQRWIAAVKDQGGMVDYEPIAADMTSANIELFPFSVFGWFFSDTEEKYASANNYNARFCYQRDDNLVTKIVFVDKSSPDKPVCIH